MDMQFFAIHISRLMWSDFLDFFICCNTTTDSRFNILTSRFKSSRNVDSDMYLLKFSWIFVDRTLTFRKILEASSF